MGRPSTLTGVWRPAGREGPSHTSVAPPLDTTETAPALSGPEQGAEVSVLLAAPGHPEPGQPGPHARRAAAQRWRQANPGPGEAH